MSMIKSLRKFFCGKPLGLGPQIERFSPEIHGIGPIGHGCFQLFTIAGRGKEFGEGKR
jgi:hypothetical protein